MPETVERCELCGGTRFVQWKRFDRWSIDQCDNCGLAVLNPHPTDAELVGQYNEYWGYPPTPTDPDEKARKVAQEGGRVREVNKLKSPGHWLDVGAGSGALLARARQDGWDVYGCEIAKHLIEYVAREYSIELFEGTLQQYEPSFRFDVISMYHILEHVTSPVSLLRAAYMRLAEDGLLVVEVPNAVSLDARWLGKKWDGWALPAHIYHFAPGTLTRMLEHSGFQCVRLDYDQSHCSRARIIRRFIPRRYRNRLLSGTAMHAYARRV